MKILRRGCSKSHVMSPWQLQRDVLLSNNETDGLGRDRYKITFLLREYRRNSNTTPSAASNFAESVFGGAWSSRLCDTNVGSQKLSPLFFVNTGQQSI